MRTAVFMGQRANRLLAVGHRLFAKDVSVLVSHAHMVFLITEVDADYRSELLSLRMFFRSFHRESGSPTAGAASTLLIRSTFDKRKNDSARNSQEL